MNQNLSNNARSQKQFVVIILFLIFICALIIPNTRDCFGQGITWQRTYGGPFDWKEGNGDCVITDDGDTSFVCNHKANMLPFNPTVMLQLEIEKLIIKFSEERESFQCQKESI